MAYRESIPNGTALPGSPQNCENANGTILLFEVISNNKIKLSFTDFDNNLIEWDLFISNQTFSTNNCFDGIQEGIFFEVWEKNKYFLLFIKIFISTSFIPNIKSLELRSSFIIPPNFKYS